ncbi:MAG: precorrin-4 C(11)-methyltransferase [Schwartzia sp. (in: firmicutes)]
MQVFIVGAGPGDPELITVKGQRLLKKADVIIYAGSLVNPAILNVAKAGAEIFNSASMTLPEVIEKIEESVKKGKVVVRLHTGDPAIYGAIQEQMDELEKRRIAFEVVPGVSSFLATAAALKQEYTLPDISQTVIVTRNEGRTPVPPRESLRSLAAHHATMCIFLSVHMISDVVQELLEGGYEPETPIAIVHKASWPEQRIVRATLSTIAEKVKEEHITRTAMIVVGWCLDTAYSLSRLYAPEYSHMYRQASEPEAK